MKLRELRIKNFRCYKDEISIFFDDLTALIGRNDAGKSTVMEALDIFFNGGLPDKHDISKGAANSDIEFVCVFDDLPEQVILDDAVPTRFADEHLLNADGYLELHRMFNGALASPKLTEWYAMALHPTMEGVSDLLKLNNKGLKDRANELSVNLAGLADRKINAQIRSAIRNAKGVGDLKLQKISFLKDEAESVGKAITIELPAFTLFKSDRPSTDQDPEAQDPLKAAIKEAVKQKEAELNTIATYISQEVKKIADLTLAKLQEMDPTLASTLTPQFSPPNWAGLFKASITGDDDIPVNKRGSGVRRLILLNFFRAKSEKQMKESKKSNTIYAVEEPETSQHPRNQRLLLSALQELSTQDQVILTTHTPMLARALPATALRFITTNEVTGKKETLSGGTDATNKIIADSLGVLPDHKVRVFIGVEGKTDIPFLKKIARVLRESGDIDAPDLEQMELDGEIIFVPLGGSGLAEWTHRLAKLHRMEFHIYDRDTAPPNLPKYQKYIDEINKRDGCKAVATSKREAENYIHRDAINAALAEAGYAAMFANDVTDTMDVATELANVLNAVVPQHDKWKGGRAKDFLSGVAVRKMTKRLFDLTDPAGEVRGWLMDIKEMHRIAVQ